MENTVVCNKDRFIRLTALENLGGVHVFGQNNAELE